MLRRLACALGWHVPKLRSDLYGYYLGCTYCDYADVAAIRRRVPHDHLNADGTEQQPSSIKFLNAGGERGGQRTQ